MTAPGAEPAALYVHVPFCRQLCEYCEFPVTRALPGSAGRFLHALEREAAGRLTGDFAATTVAIGGGTPTALPIASLSRLMTRVREWAGGPVAEWSVEANPEDLSAEVAAILVGHGVDRVCLGLQSLDDSVLAALGRSHDAETGLESLAVAGAAGLRTVAVDLLFGVRGQTEASFRRDLERVGASGAGHVSIYGLAPGADGEAAESASNEPFDGLAIAHDVLAGAGYGRYELTSFALPGHEFLHHVHQLRGHPVVALGPSAAGHVARVRLKNEPAWPEYEKAVLAGADPAKREPPRGERAGLAEDAMARLHLAEGFTWDALGARWGLDARSILGATVRRLGGAGGLVLEDGDGARLSGAGWLVADRVFAEILAAAM